MKAYLLILTSCIIYFNALGQLSINQPLRYLALGDSYTIGESVAVADRWPNQLFDKLTERGAVGSNPVIIAQTGWRTDQLKNAVLNSGLADTFNLVSVLIGVNNQYQGRNLGQYYQEFPEILNLAIEKAGGDTSKVFVVSIPDYAYTPLGQNQNPTKISNEVDIYNRINDSISQVYRIPYFNITPISRNGLNDPSLVANDGLHPSGKQYGQWVELINSGIEINSTSVKEAFKKKRNQIFSVVGDEIRLMEEGFKFNQTDSLIIFDLNGKEIIKWNALNNQSFPINISSIAKGTYILKYSNQPGFKFMKP